MKSQRGRVSNFSEYGLAIPPKQRDCVGEKCPVAMKIGSCYSDEHHLYFPRALFIDLGGNTDEAYFELRNDIHSKVKMARCRHDSTDSRAHHKMFERANVPSLEVTMRYLEESKNLQLLGINVANLAENVEVYTEFEGTSTAKQLRERIYKNVEKVESLLTITDEIEVMPAQICVDAVNRIRLTHGPMVPRINEIIAA